jgi:transcriptional regulator with XRE-family HTH domain
MTRQELIRKIHQRREQVGITLENLAKLSGLGIRTLNRLFAGEDVKFSTIEKVTNFFLDKSVLDTMIEEFQLEFLEGEYRKNLWVA